MNPNTKQYTGITLFEGSEVGDVNLSNNTNNYKYIEVIFSSLSEEFDSVKVPSSAQTINCNTVLLDNGKSNDIGIIFIAKQLKNEGTKLTVKASSRLYKYQTQTNMEHDTLNQVYIRKVIGYKN